MSETRYTYAVARIRAMEISLFGSSAIEQLVAFKTCESCLQFLVEKGWGDADTPFTTEAILSKEQEKTWSVVKDLLKGDNAILDVLSFQNLYHNLKAAIKESMTEDSHGKIYFDDCAIGGKEMARIIADKDFSALPVHMRSAAQEAYETFLHTRDGQLCDAIVDRAALEAIYAVGKNAKEPVICDYAESIVAVADIKIAVRSQKTGKSLDFMKRSMAACREISVDHLATAALSGLDAICEYLEGTSYAGGAKALQESSSAFERWCDNQLIEAIKPQKYRAFGAGPLVAYLIARENEIKTVRIILTAKFNELPEEQIRERIREMYV